MNKKLLDVRIIFTFLIFFVILFIGYYFGLQTELVFIPFFGFSASTPFIRTWNGKKFVYENDFLFGKPNSLFSSKNEGTQLYESGAVTPDLYKIQNDIKLKDGHFVAQIKEIEPEESYIDYLSLLRVSYPKNSELVIDSNFKDIHVFKKDALKKTEGISEQVVTFNNGNVSPIVGDTKKIWEDMEEKDGYMLEPQEDSIEIRGIVKDKSNPVYLLLRAHYRDWTAGEIHNTPQIKQNILVKNPLHTPQRFIKRAYVVVSEFMRSTWLTGNFLFLKTLVSRKGGTSVTNKFFNSS